MGVFEWFFCRNFHVQRLYAHLLDLWKINKFEIRLFGDTRVILLFTQAVVSAFTHFPIVQITFSLNSLLVEFICWLYVVIPHYIGLKKYYFAVTQPSPLLQCVWWLSLSGRKNMLETNVLCLKFKRIVYNSIKKKLHKQLGFSLWMHLASKVCRKGLGQIINCREA